MKKIISLLIIIAMAGSMLACDFKTFFNDFADGFVEGFEGAFADGGSFSGDNTGMRGIVDGDVYTNDYVGIKFVKPDFWGYSSDKSLAETFNVTEEMIHNDNFKQSLDSNLALYDMMAKNLINGSNVLVGYENLKFTSSEDITEIEYLESAKEQLENQSGMNATFPNSIDTAKLGNTEFTRLVYNISMNGVSMIQANYACKIDSYMAIVVITVTNGYSLEEIEAMFQ